MDKYKKLISNTVIFGIGTFGSKILVFLLMPLYTRILTNSDYGIVDLIIQTSNLLIPIVTLGITNAVIRFGLDKSTDKSEVFSTGLRTIFFGFFVFVLFAPLIGRIEYISGHVLLIYLFVLMSSLRSLCSQFVRSKEYVRLFAFDGILSTITIILFNILFLVVFRLGITGYVLAIILSDFLSTIFLFCAAKLWKYIRFKKGSFKISGAMLRYSIPLIPATVFWWITNVSDRYIVTYMLGSQANGLYAVSYKIPTAITLISGIFIQAWQMSAVLEGGHPERNKFFTKVFGAYQAMIFVAASGLIMFAKVITKILVSPAFYPSWEYIPLLVMATTFTCFVTFLGSIYMVEKKSMLALLTTIAGASINVALNFALIPVYGVNGAAFATFASYFIVFLLRVKSTAKLIKIEYDVPRFIINLLILALQSAIMISEVKYFALYEGMLFALMFLVNLKLILVNLQKIFHGKVNFSKN